MLKSVQIKIHGTVQGVFFRMFTLLKAHELGVTGWVRNASDGTVEIEAHGKRESVDDFLEWCHHGPEKAVVNKVIVSESAFKNFTSFEIKR